MIADILMMQQTGPASYNLAAAGRSGALVNHDVYFLKTDAIIIMSTGRSQRPVGTCN